MSRAVRPTRAQKELIRKKGLLWKNWLVSKESETSLFLVSRSNGSTRRISKL